MIYESTLEDVDTTVVPYKTAFHGKVSAMVHCTASCTRALMWTGAWHLPTLSWVPYVFTKVLLRQALTLRLGSRYVRSDTTFLCASEFDLQPRPNRAVYRGAVVYRCSCVDPHAEKRR